MTKAKTIDRIQKLLILAEKTTFPHERQSAILAAHTLCVEGELMARFFDQLWNVIALSTRESLTECEVSP